MTHGDGLDVLIEWASRMTSAVEASDTVGGRLSFLTTPAIESAIDAIAETNDLLASRIRERLAVCVRYHAEIDENSEPTLVGFYDAMSAVADTVVMVVNVLRGIDDRKPPPRVQAFVGPRRTTTHGDDVQRYIDGVTSGEIVTGRLERLAVWRHLDDLEHAAERGFYFDAKIAEKSIQFSTLCNQFEGEWAGRPLVLRPEQKFIVWNIMGWRQKSDGLRRFRQVQMEVGRKWGKALALDTPLVTPTGWTTMGSVRIGDTLFDEQGQPCRVTNKTEVMFNRPCYRVVFSDGTSIIADEEHEWLTETKSSGLPRKGGTRKWQPRGGVALVESTHRSVRFAKIRTTGEIRDSLVVGTRTEKRHRIRNAKPLSLPTAILPVHPYVFGAWLGDGHSATSRFTCHFGDMQIIEEMRACGVPVRQANAGSTITTGLFVLGASPARGKQGGLSQTLRKMGVQNNKHIPLRYLRADRDQRLSLLQGLMDTDGCVNERNRRCEFTSVSKRLAGDVMELARSLGLRPVMSTGRATIYGKDCGAKYRVQFTPPDDMRVFRLDRKQVRLNKHGKPSNATRAIVAVEPVESVPVQCIEVDSPSHLYLAGEAMIPTHNSTCAAYLACLLLYMDTPVERGAQVYVAATKQDQAKIVWQAAQKMIERSPTLAKKAKVTPSKLIIELPEYDSVFRPIASDSKTVDGFNPHCVIKDEEHAWREMHRGLADTLSSGFGSRSQPITITITTYGDDESLIWQENHDYAVRCLESVISGDIIDDSWFAYIAALDYPKEQPCYRCKGEACPWCGGSGEILPDDPYDETVWRKANPGIGSGIGFTPKIERMREAALMAQQRADKQAEFFQKNLNIIVSARNKAVTPEAWLASRGVVTYPMPVTGHGAYDLALKYDFAAVAMVFPFHEVDDDGQPFIRYEAITKSWCPRERPPEMQLPMFSRWVQDGYLEECSGDAIDFMEVESHILEWHRQYSVQTWAYDQRYSPQMAQRLQSEGLNMFAFGQSHKFYSAPLKEFQNLIGRSRVVNGVPVPMFKHDGNPCLAWQAGNLIIDENTRRELMPTKRSSEYKIDAMVAMLMAFSECLYHQATDDGYYLKNPLVMG